MGPGDTIHFWYTQKKIPTMGLGDTIPTAPPPPPPWKILAMPVTF